MSAQGPSNSSTVIDLRDVDKTADKSLSKHKKLVNRKYKFPLCAICIQVGMIVLFGIFVEYPDDANASLVAQLDRQRITRATDQVLIKDANKTNDNKSSYTFVREDLKYPDEHFIDIFGAVYQDTQLFLVTGLALLFVGLKNNSLSTMAIALFIYTICLEWAFLCYGFFKRIDYIKPNVKIFVLSVYFAEASMIAWGFILGRCNILQIMFMCLLVMASCTTNDYICADLFKVNDPGGVLTFNVFGTYFGVGISWWMYKKGQEKKESKKVASISSETFAFLGSSILWVLWPTALGSIFTGGRRHRTLLNTYFALLGSSFAALVATPLLDPLGKFTPSIIQNAALAGGVTISGSCDTMMGIYAALIVGSIAGVISVLCCFYVQPFLANKCHIYDTCNSHSLHGIPGIFGSVVAIVASALATEEVYGKSLYEVFPARAPLNGTTEFTQLLLIWPEAVPGDDRSASAEALYHFAAMGVTLGIALVSGFISGFILHLPIFDPVEDQDFYDDSNAWNMPISHPQITQIVSNNHAYDSSTTLYHKDNYGLRENSEINNLSTHF